jgi:arylsulfate sulfotransferase
MEPGYQFIPVMRWTERGPDRGFGLVLALDGAGEIVWYYRTNKSVNDIKRLDNGDLIYLAGRDGWMIQINKLGDVVHHWHATGIPKDDVPEGSIPVDCDSFHHDFMVMENGHFFALSTEARHYEEYATSDRDPEAMRAPSTVIGDVIVEFNRAGEVLRRWKLLDLLDPYRVSHGSLGVGFWKEPYKDILDEPGKDWGHANSIVYDASDDSVIVSLNHQSAIVKMRLEDSSIAWILGDHNGWQEPWSEHLLDPSGEVIWTGHQHAAELTPTGTVLVFDNGGHRGPPFSREVPDEKRYSRVVEFKVDEEHGTVEEVWSYGSLDTDHFFSSFLCDVDLQATTGNVIVTDGARVSGPNGETAGGRAPGHHWAHIFEVDRESGRKVFEMQIENETGWAVYRSERFSTLY